MKATFERLNYIWDSLLQCDLVQNPIATDSSINEFMKILNKSTPITPPERTTHETIRQLSIGSKKDFITYLRSHNMNGLILTCDGKSIVDELGLGDRIEIHWNNITKEYDAKKVDKSNNEDSKQKWGDMAPPQPRDKSKYNKKKPERVQKDYAPSRESTNREKTDRIKDRKEKNQRKERPLKNSTEGVKKPSIPPVSSKEQYELLKKLREKKTYAETAGDEGGAVDKTAVDTESAQSTESTQSTESAQSTPNIIGVQTSNGSIEDINITNEDLMAIVAVVGNL